MTKSLELVDGINIYKGDDYKFKLVDEKYHRYAWLIVKEKHIQITENKTDLSDKELKSEIVRSWFLIENALVKQHNNAKARSRRSNNA